MKFTLGLNAVDFKNFNVNDIKKYSGEWVKTANNFPVSFDIETTSTYDQNGEKIAFMYIWMFCWNGLVIYGRTWEEFIKLLQGIRNLIKKKIIIYVHNLAYEFQFIRKWFEWEKGFANDERNIIYGITKDKFEFRCSYMLSGMSLEKVGKNLTKYKIKKMIGDLDYSLIRHSGTPLSNEELQYCFNDVLVVCAYIQELIDKYGKINALPLTKTGFVRKYCREECCKKQSFRDLMKTLVIDGEREYNLLKEAFQGGFTHANVLRSRQTIDNVHSYDLTSSYPSVMVAERFPMSKGTWVHPKTYEEFEEYITKYACVFRIKFFDLELVENVFDAPLSYYKGYQMKDVGTDNGRIISAKEYATSMTNIDFQVIRNFYTFSDYEIGDMIIYRKQYLPKDFLRCVLKLYEDKTTLKDVIGSEYEYQKSKEMLNSTFGMSVTDIVRDEIGYTTEWITTKVNIDEAIEKYNQNSRRFLFYPWGLFITAYARRNLFTAIFCLKDDYIYSDTDSVKFTNLEKHQEYFENYNLVITNKLKETCNFYHFPYSYIEPKSTKGIEKPLGVWSYEGNFRFRTLGAKRYMTYENGELSFTISGVNKKIGVPYLLKKYNGNIDQIFEAFDDGLIFPKGCCGKMIHTYIDEECEGKLNDYLGNVGEYYEKSFIHLEEAEYNLSIEINYLKLLLGYKEIEK